MNQSGIRRKLEAGRAVTEVGLARGAEVALARGADAAWAMALARAARDSMALDLRVSAVTAVRHSLAELLELPPQRGLIVVLEGPAEALGLLVLSPDVLAGLTEMQTMGRVSAAPALPRKPTRTDAAMTSTMINAALAGLDAGLHQDDDLIWAGGFRYASFLEDARPLGLLLEEGTYRVMQAEAVLSGGAKRGTILLALPAAGRGKRSLDAPKTPDTGGALVFAAALGEQVMAADAVLEAVLARVTLPLQAVLAFKPGDPVFLGMAALDRIDLEGSDGCRLAGGKLGQNRGMRAVRMMPEAQAAARVTDKPKAAPVDLDARMKRAAGT
ncbi:MAG: FliM/FliN family flagellar motor C-terminal domain-containing protein [Paracoccaceae bacterium]|nr:FliM/FliN family flagellar motor C-terminal domain-containing protein [Paracoccaceae bacterium]